MEMSEKADRVQEKNLQNPTVWLPGREHGFGLKLLKHGIMSDSHVVLQQQTSW